MHTKFKLLLLAIALLTLAARTTLPVMAQNPTGSIRGTVTDQQGAVIQNATVTVTNKATGDTRTANTGGDGIYAVENLLPAEYEVKIEATGFATQNMTSVAVHAGTTTSGDASLRAGTKGEVVDVVAEAPIVDKQNFQVSSSITRQKIDSLPLNGRNFLVLASIAPGVSVSTKNPGSQNNLVNVSIGGAPSALTRLTVDGGSILDPVCGGAAQNFSIETIQEFQISTFNFDLSTGVTSVGAINIVSRTGTNGFHGSAFLFFRDHSLAALPTFFRPSRDFDPFFRRYQYGGAVGGPIKKDRAFFFGNYERLDQNSAIANFATGFPGLAAFNGVTSSPYKGNIGNVRVDFKISDKNTAFARYSHDDNKVFAPDADNSLPSNWRVNSNNDDNLQAALTTVLTQNLVNDVRFNFQHIVNDETIPTAADCPQSNPGCIGLGGPQIRVAGSNLRIGNTVNAPQNRNLKRYQTTDNINWVKGSHRVRSGLEWEHGYGQGGWAFLDPALIIVHDPRTALGLNASNAATINGIPGLPAALKAQLIGLIALPVPAAFTTPGATVTYNDLLGLPIVAGPVGGGIILPLVGIGDPSQPPPFQTENARRTNRFRFYGQDSWLVKPGFTFSYGASYAYETNLQNHDLAKPPLLEPLLGKLGKPGKDNNNIAPSVGFAWDVRNNDKTVIRGGAGIYYDTVLYVTRLQERATIGPAGNGRSQVPGVFFLNTIDFGKITIPGLTGFNAFLPQVGQAIFFPSAAGPIPTKLTAQNFIDIRNAQVPAILNQLKAAGTAGLSGIDVFKTGTGVLDPNLQVPYSEQLSLGFQRQLPKNSSLSVDFVMRKRVHTLIQYDANYFARTATLGGPVIRQCANLAEQSNPAVQCSNGPINVVKSIGRDQYKALLVKFEKRFSNRFQLTASYALSSLTGFFLRPDGTPENINNLFEVNGNLPDDARHRLSFSGVVNLPWDLQTSLIAVYQSRPPFNARVPDTVDTNGDGTTADTLPGLKPNSLNRGTGPSEFVQLVNQFNLTRPATSQLVIPSSFRFGDNFQSEDIRLTKTIKIRERFQIQGYFEVFNIFNISNLTFDSSTQTVGTSFGLPTGRAGQNFGTGGPRAIQFGGRFSF